MKLFPDLRELLLEDNLLCRLPENLDHLVNLKVLTLMNNPMVDPPMNVCYHGNEAIWKHLRENRIRKVMATKVDSALNPFLKNVFLGDFTHVCNAS